MTKQTSTRLHSLDTLRGFDMFWIAGGAMMFHTLAEVSNASWIHWVSHQCTHVDWHGFHFYDMIFPLFLFIAGVSFPFSLAKRISKGHTSKQIYKHIIQRGVVFVFLGIVYNGLFRIDFENLRIASVLGRIGLAWMFGALIFLNSRLMWQFIWTGVILLGYYAMMMLIPVPGYGAGDLSMEGNLASYIDRIILPGKLHREIHDPEGIFSTIPAIATALTGMLTGRLLKLKKQIAGDFRKFWVMVLAGSGFIIIALLWDLSFPINKNLWTSSFVLLTSGISLLLLSFFYLVTDIYKIRGWSFPFLIIGLNPITIYLTQSGMIDFWSTARYFFGGMIDNFSDSYQDFWNATAYFLVSWLFLYFLYRQKMFLKV